MPFVGLTGNFGMGKSTVLEIFRELGAVTIDSDGIVDEILESKDVLEKIRNSFGEEYFDAGRLNKKRLAECIFRDMERKTALEAIIHPIVFDRIEDIKRSVKDPEAIVICEVPLLFEKGYNQRVDMTIVVYADEERAIKRLEEKGYSREDVLLRIENQSSIKEKIDAADYVIENNSTIDVLREKVKEVFDRLRSVRHEGN